MSIKAGEGINIPLAILDAFIRLYSLKFPYSLNLTEYLYILGKLQEMGVKIDTTAMPVRKI